MIRAPQSAVIRKRELEVRTDVREPRACGTRPQGAPHMACPSGVLRAEGPVGTCVRMETEPHGPRRGQLGRICGRGRQTGAKENTFVPTVPKFYTERKMIPLPFFLSVCSLGNCAGPTNPWASLKSLQSFDCPHCRPSWAGHWVRILLVSGLLSAVAKS